VVLRGRAREEHPFVIHDLKRIGAPGAFKPRGVNAELTAEQKKVVARKLEDARERMRWSDVPTRVLTRALVKTAGLRRAANAKANDPALPLAGALLGRTDELVGTDAEVVAEIRKAIADGGNALDKWLKKKVPSVGKLPVCAAAVDDRPRIDGAGVAHGDAKVLEITTTCTRTESLSAIWPCIQPLNWPHCNEMFRSVTVVPHSFTTKPELAAFTRIVPKATKLDEVDALYGCRYVEDVDLCGLVKSQPVWELVPAKTVLECIEWQRRDAFGELVEVGMAYRHSDRDTDNPVVDVDEGYAILKVRPRTDPQAFDMTTLKRISFKDESAIDMLEQEADYREIFSLEWSFNFEVTADDCADRAVITAGEVEQLSAHPGASSPPGAPSVDPPTPDHWMAAWLAEAAEYWQQAASVGFRQTQRLEERRSGSGPTRTEDVFYDALEVWEANRRSLNDGLELTRRFWSALMGGPR
jgi:hypothetical protein